MKYFLPDWDHRVDPGYDFPTDRFTLVRDPYRDDRYAHELFAEPLYDGVLVSRMALLQNGPKRELVDRIGMRRFLRLPAQWELLGDCGAFGYVRQRDPNFDTAEVVDYYQRGAFDYGVSVDHLIVSEFADQRRYRYELTLRNAEEFLRLHQSGFYSFVPIGAIQGWDAASYAEAARSVTAMGYRYIAVGGLTRSRSETIQHAVGAVASSVPVGTRIHIFGVARQAMLRFFLECGVTSVDSSTPFRQAWVSDRDNYYVLDGTYPAIRVPVAEQERPKQQTLIGRSAVPLGTLQRAERAALAALRAYDRKAQGLRVTIDAVMCYDDLLAQRHDGQRSEQRRDLYRALLTARPWKRCRCHVCSELGIEVVIYRGSNRNYRRGFHNLWVFQQRLAALRVENDVTNGRTATQPPC